MPLLRISLFGEFSIWIGQQAIPLATPSYQSLLAYLVVHGEQAHTRQHLAFLIWPESTEKQARTNLRKAIHVVRRTLPAVDSYLQVNRHTVCWHPVGPVAVDVAEFQAAAREVQQIEKGPGGIGARERLVSAYHGDFLPGLFDNWILAQREQWRAQYLAALEDLVTASEAQREYTVAIRHAQRLLRADPLHETTYRHLMRLYSLAGNTAGALQVYHTCVTRLEQDLGVLPSAATRRVFESLLQRKEPLEIRSARRLPLVGRESAWQTLQQAWRQARAGQPMAVFVQGEAGIGKTRLAEEMLDWADRQGIAVLAATCYRAEQQLAYAAVARWLRGEAMQAQFERSAMRLKAEISRLLPELLVQHPNLPEPRPLTESWQRQHLFSALVEAILPLCTPALLFIDDLAWSDGDSLEWLQFLLRYKAAGRFLLLVTARTEDLTADHPLQAWRQQLARDDRLVALHLSGLNQSETAQLAEHVLQRELEPHEAAHLYGETDGNPFLVVEMARAGRYLPEAGHERPVLPPRIQSVVEERLSDLTPPAFELAQLAATIGRSFSLPLLARAGTQAVDELVHSLDELWQRRILREQGLAAYDFSHDTIRQVTYGSLSNVRRRQNHLRVALALEEVYATNREEVSGQIAAHYAAAGEYGSAIANYHRAGIAAQAVFAHRDVISHLRRAVDLLALADVGAETQVEIYALLAESFRVTGEYMEAEKALKTALSSTIGPLEVARLHRHLGELLTQEREMAAAEQALAQAEKALGVRRAGQEQAWWREWLQIQLERLSLYYWSTREEDMLQLIEALPASFEAHGSPGQRGRFYQLLAMHAFRRHRYVIPEEPINYLQAAVAAIAETGDPWPLAFAHFVLGFAYLWQGWRGDLYRAETALQRALVLAEEVGDLVVQCRSRTYLCAIHRKRKDVERLREQAPRALALAEQTHMPEYVASMLGQLAWIAWHEGDLARANELGEQAVAAGEAYPVPIPIKWPYLWPLIAAKLANQDLAGALTCAQMMLHPSHQRLHDDVVAKLELALAAESENRPDAVRLHLEEALQLAQTHHYL